MSDEKSGGFVVFPLAWLASPGPLDIIIDHGIGWGVVHFLSAEETRDAEFEDRADEFPLRKASSDEFKEHCLKIARRRIGFCGGDMNGILREAAEVERWLYKMRACEYKTECTARLRSTLLFDMRNAEREQTKGPMTENQFRVYAAAVSCIGAKPYQKIGAPMFQARAAGHLSPAGLERAKTTKMHGPILTRRQIDYALVNLVRFGWLKQAGWGNGRQVGERYWSHRLSAEELQSDIAAMKLKRAKHAHSREHDNAFSQTVRSKIADAFKAPIAPPSEPQ